MNGLRILVVDDEPSIGEGIDMILSREGYGIVCATSAEAAVSLCERETFDLILMDLILPGMDGVQACTEIRRLHPGARLMAITGSPSGERIEQFRQAGGIQLSLAKPFGRAELLASVVQALKESPPGEPFS